MYDMQYLYLERNVLRYYLNMLFNVIFFMQLLIFYINNNFKLFLFFIAVRFKNYNNNNSNNNNNVRNIEIQISFTKNRVIPFDV